MYWTEEAERLRHLAADLRRRADTLRHSGAESPFARLADQYETLASQAERNAVHEEARPQA